MMLAEPEKRRWDKVSLQWKMRDIGRRVLNEGPEL